jgi:DNA-binding transcriptional ArsR family regulator
MSSEDDVVLSDARAIRVLAHPARLLAVERLYADRGSSSTATELAEAAGLTASAMSYHLRELERHGVVERADDGSDDRRRPWRAAGRRLVVRRDAGGEDAARAAVELLVEQMLDSLRTSLAAMSARVASDPERWRVGGLSPATVHLDAEQAAAMSDELGALVERWVERSDPARDDSRPVQVTIAVVPGGPPTGA